MYFGTKDNNLATGLHTHTQHPTTHCTNIQLMAKTSFCPHTKNTFTSPNNSNTG